MTRIAFAWPGLPDYAARCIRAVAERSVEPVDVVATRPNVPIEGMERSLGQPVHWVDGTLANCHWHAIGSALPDILFVGGYTTPAFRSLAREVRAAGGKVALMSDNNWTGTVRQRSFDPVRHRLLFRRRFDAIFVPGRSGRLVARSWGYDDSVIASGLYGADPALFHGGPPLTARSKTFLFVGQFIERKDVLGLAEAFMQFAEQRPDWTLRLCGSGPLAGRIPRHPRIEVLGFVQPSSLADLFRDVRCLVLPSLDEHWGLVVHEAALMGCALALSRAVGAAEDLAQNENAVLFPAGDPEAMCRVLTDIADWDEAGWATAEEASRRRARAFGPEPFSASVLTLAEKLVGRNR